MATELKEQDQQQALTVRNQDQLPAEKEKQIETSIEKYRGISQEAVSHEQAGILMETVKEDDIEVRPDGMIYLPEIKYRRRLNCAFLPAGWALMPTSQFSIKDNTIMRQYALYVGGRFISEVVGEQEYIPNNKNMTYATAAEGCKSNALMRCCKDLGIASELWDPNFITQWVAKYATKVWNPKKQKFEYRRKDREPFFWEKKDGQQNTQPESDHQPPADDQPPIPYEEQDANYIPPDQPANDSPKISDKQRKRLYAISRGVGLTDEQIKAELLKMGLQSSADIKTSDYNSIVTHFESLKQ